EARDGLAVPPAATEFRLELGNFRDMVEGVVTLKVIPADVKNNDIWSVSGQLVFRPQGDLVAEPAADAAVDDFRLPVAADRLVQDAAQVSRVAVIDIVAFRGRFTLRHQAESFRGAGYRRRLPLVKALFIDRFTSHAETGLQGVDIQRMRDLHEVDAV